MELLKGIPLVETFMTAVSLAVAAIPEGLPAVLTLTLALGMSEMAKSDAIVRKLLSVETLGSCTIICSDKTGTLTENKMSVVDSFFTNEKTTLEIGKLCNNAKISNGEIIGDQTDGAILKYCSDAEIELERLDEIPLDSNRKMMSTIHRLSSEKSIVLTKGAPEIILDKCKYIDDDGTIKIIDDKSKEIIIKKIDEMSSDALRVIGFAYKLNDDDDPEENLTFTGLLGLRDPPKKDAKKAVEDCINAGIKVKMITGDHEKTARAIAKELGILTTGRVITGDELEKITLEEYYEISGDIQVYARVKPAQKMKIVEALKASDNIVAMTGDGVNDAPALKKASIGVAMGDGTDVAKESADMILQNNDFSTIVTAVREGRKIYDNIKRFVKFQVSTNVGAILTIIGTSILALPLPFNPVQLLWLNIVMDGPPAQTLGIEGAERDVMHRPPESGDILTRKTMIEISVVTPVYGCPEALPELVKDEVVALYERQGILRKPELVARKDIYLDQYCKTVHTEALLVLRMAKTIIFPSAMRYQGELAETASRMKNLGLDVRTDMLAEVTANLRLLQDGVAKLEGLVQDIEAVSNAQTMAERYCAQVLPLLQEIRQSADALELCIPDDLWALPNYAEILFGK